MMVVAGARRLLVAYGAPPAIHNVRSPGIREVGPSPASTTTIPDSITFTCGVRAA
ncbi:MAG: hypothetical protein OHK0015_23300 [Chloroflexi bacterium OHK40]